MVWSTGAKFNFHVAQEIGANGEVIKSAVKKEPFEFTFDRVK